MPWMLPWLSSLPSPSSIFHFADLREPRLIVLRRMDDVSETSRRIMDGDLTQRVDESRADEIGSGRIDSLLSGSVS